MGSKKQRKKENLTASAAGKYDSKYIFFITGFIILLTGIYSTINMKWVCDDAFITFRYIENWINGAGLVYNPGEYVEGYTNFLWLLLLAFFNILGFDLVASSMYLGILFFAGTILITTLTSFRFARGKVFLLPFTALMLVLHYDFRIWATSGLETSMFTFLIVSGFYVFTLSKLQEVKKALLSGTVLIFAVLTRPDGAFFYAVFFFFLLIRVISSDSSIKQKLKPLIAFIIPFIILYIPYLIWKISYYGDIYPNTYYAKAGWMSYYSQGFFYLQTYFQAYYSSWIFLIAFIPIIIFIKNYKEGRIFQRIKTLVLNEYLSALILAVIIIILYSIFFIAKVGGDFMYARFIIPIIPLLYLAGENAIRCLFEKKRNILILFFILIFFTGIIEKKSRDHLFIDGRGERISIYDLNGVADEYWFYTQTEKIGGINHIQFMEMAGKEFNRYFKDRDVRFLIMAAQASLAYYSKIKTCVEFNGLTDKYIAHLPISERGRPGHERAAPYDYVIERGVHFTFDNPPDNWADYRTLYIRLSGEFQPLMMITYDKELMDYLEKNFPQDIKFINFENYLDSYISTINTKGKPLVENDFKQFSDFYFKHNDDPERLKQFQEYLLRN
ncbi:MAG TPA: hypothetical protein PK397_09390 [Ignavibacteriaceae bacterium]|jgi:uncharacterized membrane protein|nr:hypothetical protein [Ignavibacteriaceae bacterium]